MRLIIVSLIATLAFGGCIPNPIYTSKKDRIKKKKEVLTDNTSTLPNGGLNGGVAVSIAAGSISKDQQEAMIREIDSWLGTPYKFGVVEKNKGADCSGFVGSVFKKVLNVDLPRQSADMYALGKPVEESDLVFGDLVFFQNTYKGAQGASHVGIYVGNDRFAHASTTVGVTYSNLTEPYYSQHFLGYKRVIGN
ncbi:C40 family peptidase [bacterium]|nr:C40 family peptidase [bacterium]